MPELTGLTSNFLPLRNSKDIFCSVWRKGGVYLIDEYQKKEVK
jgi:hypothetical protein